MIRVTDVTPLTVNIDGASRIVESCVAWMMVAGAPPPATTPWVRARGVSVLRRMVRGARKCILRVGGGWCSCVTLCRGLFKGVVRVENAGCAAWAGVDLGTCFGKLVREFVLADCFPRF